jgi:hypothetical protein
MSQNLVTKYSAIIDERFSAQSLTESAVNQDYDFVGAQTVKVFSTAAVDMCDYQRTGANRYGTPAELDNTTQEMTMGRDRAFTFTVDRASDDESAGSLNAGLALKRQQDEVIIPEIDRYRLARMTAFCGHIELGGYDGDGAPGPYEHILSANRHLDERLVPREGRVLFISHAMRVRLQLDPNFTTAAKIDPATRIKGQIGEADMTPIVAVPLRYLPAGIEMVLTHPRAITAPQKLAEYKLHDNPPGINGTLCEGRVYYDAFVLDNKRDAIYVLRTALAPLALSCAAGSGANTTLATVSGFAYEDGTPVGEMVYKSGASLTAPNLGDDLSGWTELTLTDGTAELTVTSGHKLVAALRDPAGKAVGASAPVAVVTG